MLNTRCPQKPIIIDGVQVGVAAAFPGRQRTADDGKNRWYPGAALVWRAFLSVDGEAVLHATSVREFPSADNATAAFLTAVHQEAMAAKKQKRRRKRSHEVADRRQQERLSLDQQTAAVAGVTDGHTVSLGDRSITVERSSWQQPLYRYEVLLNGTVVGSIEATRERETGPVTRQGRVTIGDRLVTRWVIHVDSAPDRTMSFRTRAEAADAVAARAILDGAVTSTEPTF